MQYLTQPNVKETLDGNPESLVHGYLNSLLYCGLWVCCYLWCHV